MTETPWVSPWNFNFGFTGWNVRGELLLMESDYFVACKNIKNEQKNLEDKIIGDIPKRTVFL